LIFGAATISNVSFAGTPTDEGFIFSNGTVDSIDLLGISSASFTGTNDAVLLAADNMTVLVDFTTDTTSTTETLIDATNNNLFAGQELGDAILGVTNGGLHVRGFTLGANLSYLIAPAETVLKGDADLSGVVDFGDIPAFITILQAGVFQAEADANCDTVVNFGDIPTFIAILQGQ
jgi:hypothetical protein